MNRVKISPTILKWIFFILLAGVLIEAFYLFFHSLPRHPEPQYQGRKLTAWAKEVLPSNYVASISDPAVRAQSNHAVAAIRHIGTNALPVALELCATKDSRLKKQLEEATKYDSDCVVTYLIKPEWEKHEEGNNIILALGSMAEIAIPSLIQLLQSSDKIVADEVMDAFPNIGTNVVPPLIELLQSANKDARRRAAVILGRHFGAQAPAAVPVLFQYLDDPALNRLQRVQVISALGYIKPDAAVIMPVIIRHIQTLQNETNNNLSSPHRLMLANYFAALGHLETNALPAVPFLVHILESNPGQPHSWDKEQALGNLMKIDPATAKPFVAQWQTSSP